MAQMSGGAGRWRTGGGWARYAAELDDDGMWLCSVADRPPSPTSPFAHGTDKSFGHPVLLTWLERCLTFVRVFR